MSEKKINKVVYKRAWELIKFAILYYAIVIGVLIAVIANCGIAGCSVYGFLALFFVIGIFIIKVAVKEKQRVDYIKENGTIRTGIICNIVDDYTMKINGEPLIALVVRYYNDKDELKEVVVPTGRTDGYLYKLATGVVFLIDEDTKESFYIDKTTMLDKRLQEAYDIDLERSNSAVVRRQFVSVDCPKCGATIMLANHGTNKCQFCGQLISLDDFSQADDVYDVSVQANL